MDKLKVKLGKENNPYVRVLVETLEGKKTHISMHGYLIGMEAAFQLKKDNKLHNLVIVTGSVGAGKSTLIQGLSGINARWNNNKLTLDNVAWATEKFIEKTDREDNIGSPLWWDESIQGAGGRSMAITSLGNKLKMAFVTKRFKKHTYYLAIDEINEYAWKLIKMADAWINVRRFGLRRGFFDVYTNKSKIKFIYNAFKFFNKTWDSKLIKDINPDCKGKFNNYEGLFINEEEYNKLKLEETKQIENETSSKVSQNFQKALKIKIERPGATYVDIGNELGITSQAVGQMFRRFGIKQQTKT